MNIIYFNPDEMRADALGCYGHPLVKTPNLDRLAAMGTLFEQCHVQNTVCSPSRCSFLTGTYVHNRGHRSLWNLLKDDEPNTFRYLKEGGYDVHAIGKNDLYSPKAAKSALTYLHKVEGGSSSRPIHPKGTPGYFSFLYEPLESDHHDKYMADKAVEIVRSWKTGDKPYMLFLPFSFPHCPYTAPEPWYSMYDPKDIPELLVTKFKDHLSYAESDYLLNKPFSEKFGAVPSYHPLIRKSRELDKIDPSELKKIMAVYLGMISYSDHLFGKILDAVEETGQLENTAIFAFSDHGDWAGDYGLVEKWPSAMDDKLTRIPMIVKVPGGKKGHRVAEPIECFDIVPTTLSLAGIEATHTHFAKDMGAQLKGEKGDATRAVFCEGGYNENEPVCNESFSGHKGFDGYNERQTISQPENIYYPKSKMQFDFPFTVSRTTMIRTMKYKLIARPRDVSEFYDLERDPEEMYNRYGDQNFALAQEELEGRLLTWYIETADAAPWGRDPRGWDPHF